MGQPWKSLGQIDKAVCQQEWQYGRCPEQRQGQIGVNPPTHFSTTNILDSTALIAAVIRCACTLVWAGYYISIFALLYQWTFLFSISMCPKFLFYDNIMNSIQGPGRGLLPFGDLHRGRLTSWTGNNRLKFGFSLSHMSVSPSRHHCRIPCTNQRGHTLSLRGLGRGNWFYHFASSLKPLWPVAIVSAWDVLVAQCVLSAEVSDYIWAVRTEARHVFVRRHS
jgi:hypothetical protein